MPLSAFGDKKKAPTDADLRSVLGKAYPWWTSLLASVAERIGPIDEVWGFTSANTGWGLRVCHKKRVILYMTPQKSQFLVSLALGAKAIAATHAAKLSDRIRAAIEAAPTYAEGRGVRLEVKNSRDLPSLATLAQIKTQN